MEKVKYAVGVAGDKIKQVFIESIYFNFLISGKTMLEIILKR